jgi:hypothetical protein
LSWPGIGQRDTYSPELKIVGSRPVSANVMMRVRLPATSPLTTT